MNEYKEIGRVVEELRKLVAASPHTNLHFTQASRPNRRIYEAADIGPNLLIIDYCSLPWTTSTSK